MDQVYWGSTCWSVSHIYGRKRVHQHSENNSRGHNFCSDEQFKMNSIEWANGTSRKWRHYSRPVKSLSRKIIKTETVSKVGNIELTTDGNLINIYAASNLTSFCVKYTLNDTKYLNFHIIKIQYYLLVADKQASVKSHKLWYKLIERIQSEATDV